MSNKLLLGLVFIFTISQAQAAIKNAWVYEKVSVNDKVYCESSSASIQSDNGIKGELKLTMPVDSSELPKVEMNLSGEDISGLMIKGVVTRTDRSQENQKFYALSVDQVSNDSQKLHLPLWMFKKLFEDMISDSQLTAELVSDIGEVSGTIVFSLFGATKTISQVYSDCLELGKIKKPVILTKFLSENQSTFLQGFSQEDNDLDLNGDMNLDEFYAVSQELVEKVQPAYLENQGLFELNQEIAIAQPELDNLVSEKEAQEQTLIGLKSEKGQILQDQKVLPAEKERLLIRVSKNEDILPDLKEQRDDTKESLDIADENFEDSENKMANLQNSVNSKQHQLDEISVAVSNNKELRARDRELLTQKERRLNRLENSVDIISLEQELVSSEQIWARASERLDNFVPKRRINERLRNDNSYQDVSAKLENIGAERNALQNTKISLETQMSTAKQKLKSLSNKIRVDQATLKTIDSEITTLTQQKTNNLARNNQLNVERKASSKRKKEHEWVYNKECNPVQPGKKESCKEKKRLIGVEKNTITKIDNETKKVIKQREKIEAQITRKQSQKASLPGVISSNKASLNATKNTIGALQSSQKTNNEALSGLKGKLQRLRTAKRNIEDKVTNEVNRMYNELVREESILANDVSILTKEVNNYRDEEAELLDYIDQLASSIDSLDAQYDVLVGRQTNLQREFNSAVSARDSYARSSEYKNAKIQFDDANEAYTVALENHNVVRNELAIDKSRVNEIDDTLDSHVDRIDVVIEGIATTQESIVTLGEEVEVKQSAFDKLVKEKDQVQNSNVEKVNDLVTNEKELSENMVSL